jgi:hypothetical protein
MVEICMYVSLTMDKIDYGAFADRRFGCHDTDDSGKVGGTLDGLSGDADEEI